MLILIFKMAKTPLFHSNILYFAVSSVLQTEWWLGYGLDGQINPFAYTHGRDTCELATSVVYTHACETGWAIDVLLLIQAFCQ
jgi:hypothetical protein